MYYLMIKKLLAQITNFSFLIVGIYSNLWYLVQCSPNTNENRQVIQM